MTHHSDLFAFIRQRPSMYVSEPSYNTITAFITGFDQASHGGVLVGFREWLIVLNDGPNNLSWPSLVLSSAFPDASSPESHVRDSDEADRHATDHLFQLLEDFTEKRDRADGLRRIYLEYENWLRHQDWYTPQSPVWFDLQPSLDDEHS